MRTASLLWSVGTMCLIASFGCGGNKPAESAPAQAVAATPTPAPSAVAAEPIAPAAAPSSIDEASFSLRLAEAGPYKAGELSRVVLQLEPRGKFHINQEYPVEIAVSGTADTTFPKATLAKADAAEFGEKKARFEVPFTAKSAGDHKLLANVKFAVCTDENCVPDERNLALALAVN